MSLPHLSYINSPSSLPLNGWITKDALPSHTELGCVPGWHSQWATGRLRRCRKWNSELSVQRAEEAPGVGDTLSRTGSLSLDTCLDWHLLLAPGLRPPGLGSEYSAFRPPCCRVPSSFRPSPKPAFLCLHRAVWPNYDQAGGRCRSEFVSWGA